MRNFIFATLLVTSAFVGIGQGQGPRWENGQWCTGRAGNPGFNDGNLRCISAQEVTAREAQNQTALLEKINQTQQTLVTQLKDQVVANTKAMQDLQAEIKRQNEAFNIEMQKLIIGRFQNLPAELLANPAIKNHLRELKCQILRDIGRFENPECEEPE